MLNYPEIDYQDQYYYARPKSMAVKPKSLDEVDPKLLATYEKLGIPLKEQMILAGIEGAEAVAAVTSGRIEELLVPYDPTALQEKVARRRRGMRHWKLKMWKRRSAQRKAKAQAMRLVGEG